MADMVATIQAEQDVIIRAPLAGTLPIQGAPGTGKTAVALHRAAYLTYEHRERLERSGVLFIGPSDSVLDYVASVLPSLGETNIVMSTISELLGGEVTRVDEPRIAELRGRPYMADALRAAVKSLSSLPEIPHHIRLDGGDHLVVPPQAMSHLVGQVRAQHDQHNLGRPAFEVCFGRQRRLP